MKITKIKTIAASLLITTASLTMNAQGISCNLFCVTDIQMDTVNPNALSVTVAIGGSNNLFISYPYVSFITDSNGDTIADGSVNFFGQFGNSSQTYYVSTTLSTIPANFNCTVFFTYVHFDTSGTKSLSCTLPYPCTTTGIIDFDSNEINIYPNPSNGKFVLKMDDQQPAADKMKVEIHTALGEKIYQSIIQTSLSEIDIHNQPYGIYFMNIRKGNKSVTKKIVIQK